MGKITNIVDKDLKTNIAISHGLSTCRNFDLVKEFDIAFGCYDSNANILRDKKTTQ